MFLPRVQYCAILCHGARASVAGRTRVYVRVRLRAASTFSLQLSRAHDRATHEYIESVARHCSSSASSFEFARAYIYSCRQRVAQQQGQEGARSWPRFLPSSRIRRRGAAAADGTRQSEPLITMIGLNWIKLIDSRDAKCKALARPRRGLALQLQASCIWPQLWRSSDVSLLDFYCACTIR